ncbi:hypothetical protein TPHA_0I01580 [Tetrapisispora phaffii CBS 4417]|uniref:GP-PDE domain-containing protein n=1 Tax=Tetrapisispora phaffii (strain ATCC 24235 / CBS 4417 / NBRC 1672 / NRRL Y-8282 / UCD 70-5) TaxID=1071381 RepID=G8BXN6_TETPH|nr:hypothetical protein TPHA_0I01580 [Tetrapisispora phaffii CBS 4417]CCE64664.1 hypothetical protein TPHA_0I01580 [Tetrapisispora phaffii CBS 4417]
MKFGKSFPRYQVPSWSSKYINYKLLKRKIKKVEEEQDLLFAEENGLKRNNDGDSIGKSLPRINTRRNPTDVNHYYLNNKKVKQLISEFNESLNISIKKVEDFYNVKTAEYEARLVKLLTSKQFRIIDTLFKEYNERGEELTIDKADLPQYLIDDLKEIKTQLVRLIGHFQDLKSFCEMNKKACYKILKKADKKLRVLDRDKYYDEQIRSLNFESYVTIRDGISKIERIMKSLVPLLLDLEKNSITEVSTIFNEGSETERNNTPKPIKLNSNVIGHGDVLNAIKSDDQEELLILLNAEYGTIENIPIRYFLNLLNTSAIFLAFNCMKTILQNISSLEDDSDINNRNFFHYHIISLGENSHLMNEFTQGMSLYRASSNEETKNYLLTKEVSRTFDTESLQDSSSKISIALLYILDNLPEKFRSLLSNRDVYGKTPLHYSAEFGIAEFIDNIILKLQKWSIWNESYSIDDSRYWSDVDNHTPMHLAVLGDHPLTVTKLLPYVLKDSCDDTIIYLCIKANLLEVLRALFSMNCYNIDVTNDESGETALYLASKLNNFEIAKVLLQNGASTEVPEKLFSWTPLFIAAVENNLEIAKLLIEYGAHVYVFDESGWTPLEQAVLHGNLELADYLKLDGYDNIMKPEFGANIRDKLNEGIYNTLQDNAILNNNTSLNEVDNSGLIITEEVEENKEIGHMYLHNDESVLLITLGSNDSRIDTPAVNLNQEAITKFVPEFLKNKFTLEIRCNNAKGKKSEKIDLPIEFGSGAIKFNVPYSDDNSQSLYFDLLLNDVTSDEQQIQDDKSVTQGKRDFNPDSISNDCIVGRGISFLKRNATFVGVNKCSLYEKETIPILAKNSLELLGHIIFEYMTVNPFHHPNMLFRKTERYWKSLISTRVIGHRGLGKNVNTNKTLQLGENTVESFIAASSLGASYVEFDVQLTKDNIPVIYHDFLVSETGVDIPMHELTLEQFMDLNNVQKHISDNSKAGRRNSVGPTNFDVSKPWDIELDSNGEKPNDTMKNSNVYRSFSHNHDFVDSEKYTDRMKLTKTFKKINFKGNTRGSSIASSFVTLEELFQKLHKKVGFNIECKYPMVDEAEEEDTGSIMIEMNHWVDTVLKVVFENNKHGRDIIFSSFHPDICIMLSLKQPSIPILFLTESGVMKMADARASSLQGAIKFAREWDLLGLVSNVIPILKAPRLAKIVKNNGLVFVTYGVENNGPENVVLELNAGVDAVIVDSVLAIRKGLTREYEKGNK